MGTQFLPPDQPKYVLDEVEKSMYQVVEWHIEVIFGFLISRKFNFFQADKATIQVVEWHLKVIFYLLTSSKFDFGEVEKAMFKLVTIR